MPVDSQAKSQALSNLTQSNKDHQERRMLNDEQGIFELRSELASKTN